MHAIGGLADMWPYRENVTQRPLTQAEEDRQDWQYEVANGDTVLGLAEWIEHQDEAERN
jgi:hypothetical protein